MVCKGLLTCTECQGVFLCVTSTAVPPKRRTVSILTKLLDLFFSQKDCGKIYAVKWRY